MHSLSFTTCTRFNLNTTTLLPALLVLALSCTQLTLPVHATPTDLDSPGPIRIPLRYAQRNNDNVYDSNGSPRTTTIKRHRKKLSATDGIDEDSLPPFKRQVTSSTSSSASPSSTSNSTTTDRESLDSDDEYSRDPYFTYDPTRGKLADLVRLRTIQDRISSKYSLNNAPDNQKRMTRTTRASTGGTIDRGSLVKKGQDQNVTSAIATNSTSPATATTSSIVTSAAEASNSSTTISTATATTTSLSPEATTQLDMIDHIVNNEDIDFMGQVSIGNPPQPLPLIFDTGSSDIWVQTVASQCTNCSQGPSFVSEKSTTLQDRNQTFQIQYGKGFMSGESYEDTVNVAGKEVTQVLAVANKMSEDWKSQEAAGLIGFGMPGQAKSRATPFFQNLMQQNLLPKNVFSFAFGRASEKTQSQSLLTLGGIESTKYQGEVSYFPVMDPRQYWQLEMSSVNVGTEQNRTVVVGEGVEDDRSKIAVIDTGSTLVASSKTEVAKFWAGVPNSQYVSCCGYYTYPCNQTITASFSFKTASGESKTFEMSEDDLNFGKVNALSDRCVGGILEGNTGGLWIVGLAFLKNYYSVFDVENMQIGFATPTY